MAKLATLKFSEGSFERGFTVSLQIGDENARPSTEVKGQLPSNPDITRDYCRWQSLYLNLIANKTIVGRPQCLPKPVEPVVTIAECQQAAQQLTQQLNAWLRSESFSIIRERWLTRLQPNDDLRVLLQTQDTIVQKLPWHLWDLLTYYPNVEVALSSPEYEKPLKPLPTATKPKVLAILGNSEGINVESDRETLKIIANDEVKFLAEPALKDFTDEFWQHPWRILFFAGHSTSQGVGTSGRLFVNATESLTIDGMRYALRNSIQKGLQLAIFNSCDGLGLARELADLHIPQLIVMREPVPDYVAQQFLKYFLQAFSGGKSLYQAVREARERLQGIEAEYPCATWLPVLWQNPAEVPPTWRDLMEVGRKPNPRVPPILHQIIRVIGISMLVTIGTVALRFTGWLQPLEFKAFDYLLQMRPTELPDPRLLIIEITDDDIKADQRQPKRGPGSISDVALNQLFEKLKQYQPRLIGLDLLRDFPFEQQPELAQRLQRSPNLIAICRSSDKTSGIDGNAPPPGLSEQQLGFSDFVVDSDGVIRRHLLYLEPEPASPCPAKYAFSTRLAIRYLNREGYQWTFDQDNNLQLGSVVFHKLQPHDAGYSAPETWGIQILLNYRHPQQPFEQVTLTQFLKGEVLPEYINDRIVLIGYTAKKVDDFSNTPLGVTAGVVIHAHMISQLLSAVKDDRPTMWTWSRIVEIAWIFGWATCSGFIVQFIHRRSDQHSILSSVFLVIGMGSGIGVISYLIFLNGGWIPLVPTVFAISTTAIAIHLIQINRSLSFKKIYP